MAPSRYDERPTSECFREALLRLATALRVRPHVTTYAFDEVGQALDDLAEGRIDGAGVVVLGA